MSEEQREMELFYRHPPEETVDIVKRHLPLALTPERRKDVLALLPVLCRIVFAFMELEETMISEEFLDEFLSFQSLLNFAADGEGCEGGYIALREDLRRSLSYIPEPLLRSGPEIALPEDYARNEQALVRFVQALAVIRDSIIQANAGDGNSLRSGEGADAFLISGEASNFSTEESVETT